MIQCMSMHVNVLCQPWFLGDRERLCITCYKLYMYNMFVQLSMLEPKLESSCCQAVAARLRDTDAEVRKEAVLAVAELAPGNRTQAAGTLGSCAKRH